MRQAASKMRSNPLPGILNPAERVTQIGTAAHDLIFEALTNGLHDCTQPKTKLLVVQVQPGECLLFSEKCIHATAPYTGAGERRTLFYRYVPRDAPACPDPRFQHDAAAPGLTEAQRCILGKGDGMAPSPKL